MVFLPIVTRELRVAARRSRTYYERMIAAAIWVLATANIMFTTSILGVRKHDGLELFSIVSGALFAWSMLSAWAGCDSISLEKREGTIGFLFLTDLKSHDIVLGKMAAAALPAFYVALAALPVLAISMLMGGVTAAQYARTALALLILFFLGQAVGMFSSAMSRLQGNATGWPLLIFFLYLAAFGVSSLLRELKGWVWPALLFQRINPAHSFYVGLSGATSPLAPPGYWLPLLAAFTQALIFFGLAVWALPHRWRENPKRESPWKTTWERWRFGNMAARTVFRRRLVTVNPILWLVCRRRLSPAFVWGVMGTVAAMAVFVSAQIIAQDSWRGAYAGCFVFFIISLQVFLRLGVASHASLLEQHRLSGALETVLCCSPLSAEEILAGIWLALRRYYLWPTMILVASEFMMIPIVLMMGMRHSLNIPLLCFIGLSVIVLLADLRAVAWMAMWRAMSNARPRRAGSSAFVWIILFPWMMTGACYATALVRSEFWVGIIWPAAALLNDAIVSRIARNRLRKNFRSWAVPSYGAVPGFWVQLGRALGLMRRRRRQFIKSAA